MQDEEYFKHRPKLKMDRYFIDKKDKKTICKLCGVSYIKRQFSDSIHPRREADTGEFWDYIQGRFEMVLLESTK